MAKRTTFPRYGLIAVLSSIALLAFYSLFLSPTPNVQAQENVDAAGNAACQASWQKFYQEAQQQKKPNPEQDANTKNKKVPCGSKCPGKCDFPESGGGQATVCRGDGGTSSCPSAEGGGTPPPMPQMPPPKPPTPPTPEEPQMCPDGSPKPPGGKCPETCQDGSPKPALGKCPEDSATSSERSTQGFDFGTSASFLDKIRSGITGQSSSGSGEPVKATRDMNGDGKIDAKDDVLAAKEKEANAPANFSDRLMSFFGLGGSESGTAQTSASTNTFEGQLKAIANSANPGSPANLGVKAYIVGQQETRTPPLTPQQFNALRVAAEADPQGFAEQVRERFPEVSEINNLLPTSGVFGEGFAGFDDTPAPSTTFFERIANYILGLVGF